MVELSLYVYFFFSYSDEYIIIFFSKEKLGMAYSLGSML